MNDNTIDSFSSALRGNLVSPSDSGYDEARKVYNSMHDRRPDLIVQAVDTADVVAAVNIASAKNAVGDTWRRA